MRISDWSSDVCSSDLAPARAEPGPAHRRAPYGRRCRRPPARYEARSSSFLPPADIGGPLQIRIAARERAEEHTSELQSLMRISYAVFCLKKKKRQKRKRRLSSELELTL